MGSNSIRDGKGHRAYRRAQAALKRRTANEHLPCGYEPPDGWGCGDPIDTTLPPGHRLSFTADHPDPTPYECPDCDTRYATQSAAQDCCSDWLGLDD